MEGFKIADEPVSFPSKKTLLFSDVKGNKIQSNENLFATGAGELLLISPEGKKTCDNKAPGSDYYCCFDENEEHRYLTAFAYVVQFQSKGKRF